MAIFPTYKIDHLINGIGITRICENRLTEVKRPSQILCAIKLLWTIKIAANTLAAIVNLRKKQTTSNNFKYA